MRTHKHGPLIQLTCLLGLAITAMTGGCITPDEPAVSEVARSEMEELDDIEDLLPTTEAKGACFTGCNPRGGSGGTRFCIQACGEPTARCFGEGTSGQCIVP
jgi:hypothetical protein